MNFDMLNENVERVREKMEISAKAAGRNISDIILCAASKTQTIETVTLAQQLNIDIFGENRVQELREKMDGHAYGQKPCHLIGHLQSNKVRMTVGRADVIESVDSIKLMDEIDAEAIKRGIIQKILIEVNIGSEQSKSGIDPKEVFSLVENAASKKGINLCGIMSIPPIAEKKGQNRQFFSTLYQLFIDIETKKYDNVNMRYLSMGMSGDFEDAIAEGANIVRVGSAIFGKRN